MDRVEADGSIPGPVRQERQGSVLVLVIDHPPVNTISQGVRTGLGAGLDLAAADATLRAVVIRAEGQVFSTGADIGEIGAQQAAELGALCQRIEHFPKLVIAALQGNVLGSGLELALAAHLRIADAGARFGLPEISLGLVPGAGGTQRLPRLIGAADALRMLLTGVPVAAPEALAMGLIDRVVPGELAAAAMETARLGAVPVARGMRAVAGYIAAITAARARAQGNRLPAPARVIDCVEAALLLPGPQALAFERTAYEDLVASPEAAGLRHAFYVERRAGYPPAAVAAAAPPKLGTLAVWGGDGAGDLIAQALAAGLGVTLVDPERPRLVAALERIAGLQESAVTDGKLSAEARDADWARLTPVLATDGLIGADLVLVGPGAVDLPAGLPLVVLGSLPARDKAGVALSPASALGGMAEIAMGSEASPVLGAQLLALTRQLNWRAVFVGAGGTVERRLRLALSSALSRLENAGVARAQLTAALAAYGMGTGGRTHLPAMPTGGDAIVECCLAAMANAGAKMLSAGVARRPLDIDAVALLSGLIPRWEGGPMFLADRRGLLVLRADLRHRAKTAPDLFAPAPLIDQLIAEGRGFARGIAFGSGWSR